MSKKQLPVEKKTEEPIEYDNIKRQLRLEEIKEKLGVDGFLRDYINMPLKVIDVEMADRGMIITCEYQGKTLRLWTNSSIVIKEYPRLVKGIQKFGKGSIVIVPKLNTSKTGKTYLTI